MRMRIHEAWRKRHVAKIDHFRVARNDDNTVRDKRFRFSIEDPRRFQHDRLISGTGGNAQEQKDYNAGRVIKTRRDSHPIRLRSIGTAGKEVLVSAETLRFNRSK